MRLLTMAHRKLSDADRWQAVRMVRGGMSYIKTAERFNVSHSVIVRLKQRVNQTGSVKERQRTGKPLKTTMRLLTIHRLRSVFAVLNGHCLASLLRSLSSFGVVFRGFPVLWRSFTLPVWFTRCFNRTMTEWLTLNRSAVFM
jgi:hypothetical protein